MAQIRIKYIKNYLVLFSLIKQSILFFNFAFLAINIIILYILVIALIKRLYTTF